MATNGSRKPTDVRRFRIESAPDDRLDAFLADRLHLSRNRVSELIDAGLVRVDGLPARKSRRLRGGEMLEVRLPPRPPTSVLPEPLDLDIVHRDEHLLVVDKPAGLVVHPGAGHASGTLVNGLLYHVGRLSSIGEPNRPGIVHRLDKDTSGLMIVALQDDAHRDLSLALAARRIRRGYLAACWGELEPADLTIDRPVGRDPRHRKRMAVVESGRPAVTHVRRLERWRSADLVAVRLQTGRTHQIRVHLRSTGHPVVGDPIYGAGWHRGFTGAGGRWAEELDRRAGRLFLHAARLSFRHPVTAKVLTFTSPLPEPLRSAVRWARGAGTGRSDP